jgi:hypothetical protein
MCWWSGKGQKMFTQAGGATQRRRGANRTLSIYDVTLLGKYTKHSLIPTFNRHRHKGKKKKKKIDYKTLLNKVIKRYV